MNIFEGVIILIIYLLFENFCSLIDLGPTILFIYLEHEFYHFSYGVKFVEFKFLTLLSLSSLLVARDIID